jgi:hypothetical protein
MDFNNKIQPEKAKLSWQSEKYRQPLREFLIKDPEFRKKASTFGGKEIDDESYAKAIDSFLDYSEHDGLMDYYLTDVEDQGGSWIKFPDGTYVNLDDLYADFELG